MPVSIVLGYVLDVGPVWVFLAAILAIVPLAEWIRRGTEQMAVISGPAIGGLLNVTFGNMAELVIALFVLMDGHTSWGPRSRLRSWSRRCWSSPRSSSAIP